MWVGEKMKISLETTDPSTGGYLHQPRQKQKIRNPQFLDKIFYDKNIEKFHNRMLATRGWREQANLQEISRK
jgi:hypothetical protein